MRISASLYSNRSKTLPDLVKELDKYFVDFFHIDCNDDPSVFTDLREIVKISNTALDVHIIADEIEKYFPDVEEIKPEFVTIQYENLKSFVSFPPVDGVKFGIGIKSETSVEVFSAYAESCDFILLMASTPGQSGGKFNKENFKKIHQFRKAFPGKSIHVDGGVNEEIACILRLLGVNLVVSGSYLVNNSEIARALLQLRRSVVDTDFKIEDFMLGLDELPFVSLENENAKSVIKKIEEFRMGYVLFSDASGKFAGVSSNADVRKGLLKNIDDMDKITIPDILNADPVFIYSDQSVKDLLQLVQAKKFAISFLPVLDGERRLCGAINFFNLIRSES